MRTPTLKHLRIVAEIARCGKINGAADALGVTSPAVTLQLQQLEQMVGMPLFERERRRMRPTAAGEILLECAQQVESRLALCVDSLEGLRGLKTGRVAIGVVSTAKYFAPAALGAFKRAYGDLELRLSVSNRGELIKALAALDVDLAIMGRPPEGLEVEAASLGPHPHVIIAAPGHRLANVRNIALDDLADEALLLREPGSGTRTLTENLFAGARIRPRTAMEISSNETIKQAVIGGLGIAMISGHTIAAEVQSGRLIILDVEGLPLLRQWFLVRHARKRIMPSAAALWDFLVRHGPAFLPDPPTANNRGSKRAGKVRAAVDR